MLAMSPPGLSVTGLSPKGEYGSAQQEGTPMSMQIITVELRRWIVEQRQAGVSDDAVRDGMVASGWHRDVALGALEEARGKASAQAAPPSPGPGR
jgi:prolyl 4-hydroxylase